METTRTVRTDRPVKSPLARDIAAREAGYALGYRTGRDGDPRAETVTRSAYARGYNAGYGAGRADRAAHARALIGR